MGLMAGICNNCGSARAICKGQCHACDEYQRRTGQQRPENKIVARNQRLQEGKKR